MPETDTAPLVDYLALVTQARERIRALEVNLEDVLTKATDYIRPCKACGVKLWFVRSVSSDKLIPYTVDGTNHFTNCLQADQFRKAKSK